jgi:uncharacterized protein
MSTQFVKSPHDLLAVGDVVKAWVLEVDKSRRRVSLTLVPPDARPEPGKGRSRRDTSKPDAVKSPATGKPEGEVEQSTEGTGAEGTVAESTASRTRSGKPVKGPKSSLGGPARRGKASSGPRVQLTSEEKQGATPLRSFAALKAFCETQKSEPAAEKTEQPETGDENAG